MLKTIDILLGLSVVMLVVSMAVTVLTQFVSSTLNNRGRHLLHGLADLLQQIDPGMERKMAKIICGAILTHPMIRNVDRRYGSTIHREEFTKLLMDFAAGQISGDLSKQLGNDIKDKLTNMLSRNGIADPTTTLNNVRLVALQLELSKPDLATNVRHGIALIQEANSQLVAKINSWFDQTIDRVADRFTYTTKVVTFVCSLLVACLIQLDTVDLINRLSVDPGLRDALVQQAMSLDAGSSQRIENFGKLTGQQKDDIEKIGQLGLISIPKSYSEWCANWKKINPLGVTLSVLLLSLGAPFWYNALKNMLKLRGTLAGKDDTQRETRQNTQES